MLDKPFGAARQTFSMQISPAVFSNCLRIPSGRRGWSTHKYSCLRDLPPWTPVECPIRKATAILLEPPRLLAQFCIFHRYNSFFPICRGAASSNNQIQKSGAEVWSQFNKAWPASDLERSMVLGPVLANLVPEPTRQTAFPSITQSTRNRMQTLK